jgi:hypothetical protein
MIIADERLVQTTNQCASRMASGIAPKLKEAGRPWILEPPANNDEVTAILSGRHQASGKMLTLARST